MRSLLLVTALGATWVQPRLSIEVWTGKLLLLYDPVT